MLKSIVLISAAIFFTAGANSTLLYDNGALRGETARNIGFGVLEPVFSVSDSFILTSRSTLKGVSFGSWVPYAETVESLYWSIGDAFFGDSLGAGHVTSPINTSAGANGNHALNLTSFDIASLVLDPGTHYLTLSNARNNLGGTVFWDVSYGTSSASQTLVGPVESNAFQIYGTVPEPSSVLLALLGLGLVCSTRHSNQFNLKLGMGK